MRLRPILIAICLLACLGGPRAGAQNRIKFERKKFDRSRFERPGQPEPAAPAAEEPAGTAAAPGAPAALGGAEPGSAGVPADSAPPATAPMATTAPDGSAVFSSNSVPSPRPHGGPVYPPGATPEEKAVIDAPLFDEVPAKWFKNAKDHEDLVALQKKTGACLLVYFKNMAVPNEKGLCSWFEKKVTTDIQWRKAMKYYLKLVVDLPGPSATRDLVTHYRAGRTPAFFVVKPGDTHGTRLKLFEFAAGSRPEPIAAELVLQELKAASTPAYQPLFQ